jgi:peptidoglycan/LPS O-acetylase OafA/YrhL
MRRRLISTHRKASPTLSFNPNLHGLRGIAAMAVLLFHWGSRLGHFREVRPALVVSAFDTQWDLGMGLDFGFLGVSLFFILSGYLLTSQLISRDVTATIASRFWQRHGLRIYLAFWLQLIVLLVLAHFLDFMPQMSSVGDLIRHALL